VWYFFCILYFLFSYILECYSIDNINELFWLFHWAWWWNEVILSSKLYLTNDFKSHLISLFVTHYTTNTLEINWIMHESKMNKKKQYYNLPNSLCVAGPIIYRIHVPLGFFGGVFFYGFIYSSCWFCFVLFLALVRFSKCCAPTFNRHLLYAVLMIGTSNKLQIMLTIKIH
jgi:hypothetical protein